MPSSGRPCAECWFLDVGQGTSNIVLLGAGRAIVIDCGPKGTEVPLLLLKRHVHTIEALIISHNDGDHDGGVARILEAYPRAIKRIFFLVERPAIYIRTHALVMREKAAKQLLADPERLEASSQPQSLYRDTDAQIDLRLFYPTFSEALGAEAVGERRPNASSAVLVLFCGNKSIVFSGDATMEAWTAIAQRLSQCLPLSCDIMTVPHHGGHITPRLADETDESRDAREQAAAQTLYGKIIRPHLAIVSVGSSNKFRNTIHPIPTTIAAIRNTGTQVSCTQMTPHCSDDLELVRPGILSPAYPSRSSDQVRKTASGRSKDVACAGSIIAEISPSHVSVVRWHEHSQIVDERAIAGSIHPLCHASK
jgi:beta-lactamase superfamily II metal-dependent hydrolase